MPYKKYTVYHTPQWYYEHCRAENGGSPRFRMMLKNDMAFIAADNDSNLCYQEKIKIYEERWNCIFSNWKSEDPSGVYSSAMIGAMEREGLKNYQPERNQVEVAEITEAGRTVNDEARENLKRRMKLGHRYFDDTTV